MSDKNAESFSFEDAYARLETILEELNSSELVLEKSLKLYEEADKLIAHCTQKLSNAEQKIEMLIKNREGQIEVNDAAEPKLQEFSDPTNDDITF